MDISMPVLSGVDATKQIRSLPGYATVPIVGLSSNPMADDAVECREAGMTEVLAKPLTQQAWITIAGFAGKRVRKG